MDNSEKDGEDMPGSEFDDDVEQDYHEEAATKIPKKASLGRDSSRLEMFESCFSKNGTTKNAEASNAIAQMKQIKSNLPEGSNDKPGPDDVFSKVMGKDRNGDAVMYGLGVRASDVWGVIPSRSACRKENLRLKA